MNKVLYCDFPMKRLHQCSTPLGAIQLSEDMIRIETALFAIERISPESVNRDRNKGWADRASVLHALRDWHAFARNRLRQEFLKA